MQMHGKHADDVADAVRHHEIDRALALIESDQAGGDDPPGFEMRRAQASAWRRAPMRRTNTAPIAIVQ
jgi:hypothetical protein